MVQRLTKCQVRGARAMLDWSLVAAAAATRLSVSTIIRSERDPTHVIPDPISETLRVAFEREGVSFLADDGGGSGVRLRSHVERG